MEQSALDQTFAVFYRTERAGAPGTSHAPDAAAAELSALLAFSEVSRRAS